MGRTHGEPLRQVSLSSSLDPLGRYWFNKFSHCPVLEFEMIFVDQLNGLGPFPYALHGLHI